jgi:hypothetical protein
MKYSDYIKRTAWEVHELATKREEIYQPFSDDPVVLRKLPALEQAKAFVDCAQHQREYLLSLCYGGKRVTYEEGQEIFRLFDEFEEMALDMRDVVFVENGKQGLRRVTGELLVPAMFDSIPERYDYISQLNSETRLIQSIPVIKNNKYALCLIDGQGTLMTDFVYDKIFRYYYGYTHLFVVERNGKKGLIDDRNGEVVVPCEMDEFYEQMDTDGIIPYSQGQKWGMLHFDVNTGAIFDDIDIRSEQYAKGKIEDEWYFVKWDGKPTKKEDEAWFGSWYDADK